MNINHETFSVKGVKTIYGDPRIIPDRPECVGAYFTPEYFPLSTRGTWRKVWLPELVALRKAKLGRTPMLVYLTMRHFARGSMGMKQDFRWDSRGLGIKAGGSEVTRTVVEMAVELGMSEDAFRAGMQDLRRRNLIHDLGRGRWRVVPVEMPHCQSGVAIRSRGPVLRLSLSMLAGLYVCGAGPRACLAYLFDRTFTYDQHLHDRPPSYTASCEENVKLEMRACLTGKGLARLMDTSLAAARELRRRLLNLGLLRTEGRYLYLLPSEAMPYGLALHFVPTREGQNKHTQRTERAIVRNVKLGRTKHCDQEPEYQMRLRKAKREGWESYIGPSPYRSGCREQFFLDADGRLMTEWSPPSPFC